MGVGWSVGECWWDKQRVAASGGTKPAADSCLCVREEVQIGIEKWKADRVEEWGMGGGGWGMGMGEGPGRWRLN